MPAAIVPSAVELAVPPARPGQPAALLERRPDLLALKSQLDAANWRRQQAKAEWFPRSSSSALFGRQSLELNEFDLGATRFTKVSGPASRCRSSTGAARGAINEIAEAGQREALLRAEDGIVRALEDVENALVALRDERQRSEPWQRRGLGRVRARPRAIAL